MDDWAARNLGVSHDKQAKARMTLGDIARKNADIAGDERKDRDAAARLYADAWTRYSEMTPYAESARDLFTRLSETNPHNALFRRDLWLAHHNIGVSLMSRAQVLDKVQRGGLKPPAGTEQGGDLQEQTVQLHERALAEFAGALKIAEELGASDAANLEAQRDIALCLNKVGNEQRDLSLLRNDPRMLAEAERTFEASLKLREGMLKADPMQRHRRDLALGLFKLADIKHKSGDGRGAKGLYEACIAEFETLVREGVARPEDELKEARNAMLKLLASPPGERGG
jgi:hypothetical protein